jgi:signal transduction histidine kinase
LHQNKISSSSSVYRPSAIILAAVCFFYITIVMRTLAESQVLNTWLPVYLGLEVLYGVLFTLMLWRPVSRRTWQHLYFVFQSLLALFLLALHPDLDFTNVLLVLLSFQAALVFSGRTRWIWVAVLLVLIVLSLMLFLGVYGLALALLPMTVGLVFPAYVAITQEIEAGQRRRQALLAELQEANRQLTAYAGQVEELSAIQERNRLARELHDSVSQTMFSIGLNSRAARILLERDPDRLRPQLEQLQALTRSALEEMRGLIAELRPQGNESGERPTS